MQHQDFFQEQSELDRLHEQRNFFAAYEAPIFGELFAGRSGLTVLDIGCSDGSKTAEYFSDPAVSRVIGLEYNPELVKKAQARHGDARFSFHVCDVERPDFAPWLRALMDEAHVPGFDIIYLSCVLMHLRDARRLLCTLHAFLRDDGRLVIVDSNDAGSALEPDEGGLLAGFLDILRHDTFAGRRNMGAEVCAMLEGCGYDRPDVRRDAIWAGPGDAAKKAKMYNFYFAIVPEDIALLCRREPDNETYKAWALWVQRSFETLRRQILDEKSRVAVGVKILTCGKRRARSAMHEGG